MGRVIKATAASRLASKDVPVPKDTRSAVIELASAMAARIVHAEVERNPAVLDTMFASALASARGLQRATVKVHPADRTLSTVDAAAGALGFAVETDEGVGRGGCRIEGPAGTVDATIQTLIDAMAHVLEGTL